MRLDGRRNSSNIEDRRHISGKAIGIGGGITGVIVAAIITLLSGGSLTDVARNTIGVLGRPDRLSRPRLLQHHAGADRSVGRFLLCLRHRP